MSIDASSDRLENGPCVLSFEVRPENLQQVLPFPELDALVCDVTGHVPWAIDRWAKSVLLEWARTAERRPREDA